MQAIEFPLLVDGAAGRLLALGPHRRASCQEAHGHCVVTGSPADAYRKNDRPWRRCAIVSGEDALDLMIVASGLLHADDLAPEKSYRQLSAAALSRYFIVNATGPALVARHLLPLLHRDRPAVFAALSARVGSIGDNRLGGWHGYRASKAALNMIVKTLSIEFSRTHPEAACVALHPGTVATDLSAPFSRGVPADRLFGPDRPPGICSTSWPD